MIKKFLIQTFPIIFNIIYMFVWLFSKFPWWFSVATTAYGNLIFNLIAPIYILIINYKEIDINLGINFKILVKMYLILYLTLCFYLISQFIFTSMDTMGIAILKGVFILTSITLLGGWLLIVIVKSIKNIEHRNSK